MNIKYIKTTDNKKYDLRDKRITDTDTGIATQSANGLLSSGDKKKLDGIASGAEVNQNAFSNIKIGNTTIAADGKTDTVELTAGNNITLTPDAANDKITIAATNTNTTYTFKGGTNQFTVTPSNGTAQTVSVTPSIANNVTGSDLTANTIILGNGNSGVKKSGKTIVTTLGSDDTTLPTSKAVKAAIDALPEPMIFKGTLGTNGTITSLPTAAASNEGYTYKVITAGTYASQYAKTGDVFISNGSSWNLIPSGDEPSGTVTNILQGAGIVCTPNPITSSGTISHADTSSQASVSNSGRTYILSITLDSMGHVTGIASATETVTNTDNKVCQTLTSANINLPLLMSYNSNTITADTFNIVFRNNSIYANPAEGTITAKLKGNIYGQFLRQADVETVSAARYVYVKLGTFDFNSFGTLCVHLEGDAIKDELYINYGSGNAYSPVVCGWNASHAGNVKEIDLVYGKPWNGDCELWLNVYQPSTLNIAVLRAIRGDGFTVNTAANWSATTTSPTFNKKFSLIRGLFGDLSGNASSASKLTTNAGSATQPVYFSEGVPTAISYTINKSVPSNAVFTDTHYITHLYAGSGTAANAATTNGNTKLTVVDDTTTRNSVTIKGTGGTTVMSDANGVVTIDSVNKNSKWFNFYAPSKVDNAYYFIISPIGGSTATPSGTCYSIEINAVVQSSPGNYIVRSAKFVTCCVWYSSDVGLRITYPIYKNSDVLPIYYHNKAEGPGVGNETRSSNVCNIPIKVENVESLVAVNIKVDGTSVSDCICTRSYSSFNWGQGEPTSWSAI